MRDEDNYFDSTDKFGFTDNHFMIGAAVTAFDGKHESIEDPSIGQIKFFKKSWGGEFSPDEPAYEIVDGIFQELPTVTCQSSSFNHDRSNERDSDFFASS